MFEPWNVCLKSIKKSLSEHWGIMYTHTYIKDKSGQGWWKLINGKVLNYYFSISLYELNQLISQSIAKVTLKWVIFKIDYPVYKMLIAS